MFAGCVCVGWGVTLRFVQSVCGGNVGLQGVCACVGRKFTACSAP